MGKSQEVKDFVSGFTAGFKMMDDSFYKQALADYYMNGKQAGRGRRNNSPNLLQRLFGAEEKKYDDPHEEALANLQKDREQFLRDGNIDEVKKTDQRIVDVGKMMKPSGSAASPAASAPRREPPAPVREAIPSKSNAGSPAGDDGGTMSGPSLGDNPGGIVGRHGPSAPARNGIRLNNLNQNSFDGATISKASLASNQPEDPIATEARIAEPEVNYTADDVAPVEQWDGSEWVAGGGYIGSTRWPVEEENDPGYSYPDLAIPENARPENAPYQFDGEYEPEYEPEYHDDEASIAVTQQMAQAAAPGVDAGLRLMQTKFAPQAGLPDADPAVADRAAAFARNEGAATHEEVAAIDAVVDPEGKLPPSAKSAARIAAVWDFYSKIDPNKAADMATRLMLYDKQNSQVRGALALQAIEQGNYGAATKLVQDGFNKDVPGGGLIQKAVLRDDGNVDVTMRTEDGPQEQVVPKEMIVKAASAMANGTGWTQQVIDNSARALAAVKKPTGQRSAVAADEDAAREYMTAKIRLRQAIQSNDRGAIERAQADLAAAENSAVEFAVKQKNPEKSLRAMGINPNAPLPKPQAPPKAPPAPKLPQLTEKERAELADQQTRQRYRTALGDMDDFEEAGIAINSRDAQALPVNSGRMASERTREEEARRTIEPLRKRVEREAGAYAYNKADSIGSPGSYEDVAGPDSAFDEAAKRLNRNGKPVLTDRAEKEVLLRQAYRLSKKNDVAPGQIVEFLYNAQNDPTMPMSFDRKTGRLTVGNNKLLVDDDTLTDIARARGALKSKFIAEDNKRMNDETADYQKSKSEIAKRERDRREFDSELDGKKEGRAQRARDIMRDRYDSEIENARKKPVKGFNTDYEREKFRKDYEFDQWQKEQLAGRNG